MKKPIVVINFKTYEQGKSSIELAKKIQKVNKNIIIVVQLTDIKEISKKTKLRVYAQHVDYKEKGRATGFVIPEAIKSAGAIGSFLNHSEHKLSFNILKKTIQRCREVKLKIAVFAPSIKQAKKIERLKPDFLIYEPPELVGGKISVSTSRPGIIKKISKEIKMPFLVGAGIHSREDVKIAMKLGASGIAISSSITQARNPEKKLRELLRD